MKQLLANYHTHTYRCGHAQGEDREYIENAISAGLKILGFSDHTPMPFKNDFYSGHRVPLDMADDYFYSLTNLKNEYKNDIEIHIGVETEYYHETFDEYCEYMSQYPCEYMILGQHFLNREEDNLLVFEKTTDEQRLKLFFDNMIDAVNTGRFLYVAHPDVIKYIGESEIFVKEARRFFESIKDKNIPVEINRLGLEENRHYPRDDMFNLVAQYNIPTIIGIDAHNPEALSNKAMHNKCIEYAEIHKVNLIENNILISNKSTET